MSKIIIGITGTIGSGKSSASKILVDNGFIHLSVRHYLEMKLEEEKMIAKRENLAYMANKLRKENGEDAIIKGLYQLALKKDKPVVIESIRAVAEKNYLKKNNKKVIAITAPLKTRYERIKERGLITDDVSFEQFKLQEEAEANNLQGHKQNLNKTIKGSDYVIENNKDLDDLKKKLFEVLEKIETKSNLWKLYKSSNKKINYGKKNQKSNH